MNSRAFLLVLALFTATPAHAFEAPLAYAKSELRIAIQHPVRPKDTLVHFDTEIRSSDSAKASPGWYNFATMGDFKAAMVLYNAPQTITIARSTDYAAKDILFVDADGVIQQILPSLIAVDLQDAISSTTPMKAIIYMQGGACAKLGIQPGDQVQYGLFRKKPTVITRPAQNATPATPAITPLLPPTQAQLSQPTPTPADQNKLIEQILKQQQPITGSSSGVR